MKGARKSSEPRLFKRREANLDEIWLHIAGNSAEAADRMIDAIMEASRMHVQFPGMGQSRDELRPGLCCFVVSPYVVFYRPMEDTIDVLSSARGTRYQRHYRIG